MVVPKKWGKWKVCVDYTDLNEAYSKNSFLFPYIDQIVDLTPEYGMLSFLDAFFKSNQIPMHLPNIENTIFITP